jgi:hypothetical protein
MYDLGYELRPFVDKRGVGRWDLSRVDGVGSAILNQKGEESEDGADEEDNNNEVENKKYCKAASHGCMLFRMGSECGG